MIPLTRTDTRSKEKDQSILALTFSSENDPLCMFASVWLHDVGDQSSVGIIASLAELM